MCATMSGEAKRECDVWVDGGVGLQVKSTYTYYYTCVVEDGGLSPSPSSVLRFVHGHVSVA